jgi:hypothetical protein
LNANASDVLTATNTALAVTPESLSALWKRGTDVAGAATITLGDGGLFHITGNSWTCSDVDFAIPVDGRPAQLIVDGTGTTFTNGANLVCPGGQDLKPSAGDILVVTQDSGDKIVISTPSALPTAWVKLAEYSAIGADIRVAFDSYPNFNDFEVRITGLNISATSSQRLTFSNDSGATFLATNYYSRAEGYSWNSTTTTAVLGPTTNANTAFWQVSQNAITLANAPVIDITISFNGVQSSTFRPRYTAEMTAVTNGITASELNNIFGFYNAVSAVNEIKVAPSSGTYTAGTVVVMGRR